jgi:hypothetical protein
MKESVVVKYFFLSLIAAVIIGCSATQPVPWVSTPEYDVEYDLAWDLTVGLIGEHFDIERVDKGSGYIQTVWKSIDFLNTDEELLDEVDEIGVRITCRVEGRFPFQLKLRVERGFYRDGEWIPIWVDYSRESICQRCSASQDWVDERLEREILRELGMRLTN